MKKNIALALTLSMAFAFSCTAMAEETTEAAAEAATEAASEAESEDVKSEGVMTYDEYMAAAVDDEVVIEAYVQAKQSWWEDKATLYTQDKDGAYFVYNAACSEDDYAKLVPGTKIKVTGYKAEWSGEVEISRCDHRDRGWQNTSLTRLRMLLICSASDELIELPERVCFLQGYDRRGSRSGRVPVTTSLSFTTRMAPGSDGDDLYFNVSLNGETYTFTVESYLCDNDN